MRERILKVTAPAPAPGQQLDNASKIAKAAGGKYSLSFSVAKELIADETLKLRDGSYRSELAEHA